MICLALAEGSIQLVPDGTVFFHIAVIILMVYVLNATLFRPINRILAEREARARSGHGAAHDILKKVEENLSLYEEGLRSARTEGYRLLEQERAEALSVRQAQVAEVRAEAEQLIAAERDAIRTQTDEARATLGRDAARMAAEISTQILHRPVGA
ncbi:MAG: ATP synthase F0 subunit B [Pyrinomonadaceae bacterium]